MASNKVEGPSTTLTFLGIEIDSVARQLRLPSHKLALIQSMTKRWLGKRTATKHELQVLLGHLNHAATVVGPGRTFVCHLIESSKGHKQAHHRVRLNRDCQSDLAWWALFLHEWNGVAYFPSHPRGHSVVADASGTWGCAAANWQTGAWFQVQWPPSWANSNIATKELLPLVISAALWGKTWEATEVALFSDNEAVVWSLSRGSAKDQGLMQLLRCLFFFEAHFKFSHSIAHIPGRRNVVADALSRNQMLRFHANFPQAQPSPSRIPPALLAMLMGPAIWREQFRTFLREVSQK